MEELREAIRELFGEIKTIDNPSPIFLRKRASEYSIKNELGILLFHTKVTARSPESKIEDINIRFKRKDESTR